MPCMKCANGKWKYGERGRCVFDTLAACKAAAAAIHIKPSKKPETKDMSFSSETQGNSINKELPPTVLKLEK